MAGFVTSILIFAAVLIFIFLERIHRTTIAIAGGGIMVTAGIILGFYSEEEAIAAIDFATLGLLFGMMILVALLKPTGFFEYLAIQASILSGGKPVRLLVLLGTVTTVLSMFLDNVTTVVLIAPVTVLICEVLGLSPLPFLISEAILSNTGGVGTLVGDPPNVLIGTAVPLAFGDFLTHSLPVVLVVWLGVLLLLIRLFRRELVPPSQAAERISQLDPDRALDDPVTARRVLIVLGAAIFLFFVHQRLHISPAFVALLASSVALIWVRPDVPRIFEDVEWTVLFFFAALFVMVGGLEAAGVLDFVAAQINRVSQHFHPAVLGILMIWLVALLSSTVGNIPITIALIPVIQQLEGTGNNVTSLWWALVFGAGFGGNGTIMGSAANVIVVSLSAKTRTPITAVQWSKIGLPVMVAACVIASVIFVLFYSAFTR